MIYVEKASLGSRYCVGEIIEELIILEDIFLGTKNGFDFYYDDIMFDIQKRSNLFDLIYDKYKSSRNTNINQKHSDIFGISDWRCLKTLIKGGKL